MCRRSPDRHTGERASSRPDPRPWLGWRRSRPVRDRPRTAEVGAAGSVGGVPGPRDEPGGAVSRVGGHGDRRRGITPARSRRPVPRSTHGDVPIGAVVVLDGEVLGSANERELRGDPTAHAEVLALRDAAAVVGWWRLLDATIDVTLEPCPMCAGAMHRPRRATRLRRRRHEGRGHRIALPPGQRSPAEPRVPHPGRRPRRRVRRAAHRLLRRPALAAPDLRHPSHRPPLSSSPESCRSGRTGRSRKPLRCSLRGFESHTLRHLAPVLARAPVARPGPARGRTPVAPECQIFTPGRTGPHVISCTCTA